MGENADLAVECSHEFMHSSHATAGFSRALNARQAMLHGMIFDTILARCRELLRRGRQYETITIPNRMPVTSDPELHPLFEPRD